MKTRFLLLSLFVVSHLAVFGQRVITAKVVDKETRQPVGNAKVTIIGTETFAMTNAKGYFQLTIDSLKDLVIESEDYQIGKTTVPESNSFQIPLEKAPEKIYMLVEVPAQFPGGLPLLTEFVRTKLSYPMDARRMGIEGTVFVSFVIDKSGDILPESIEVVKGIYPSCNAEAERLIRRMPKWTPAMQGGKPVRSRFVMPVRFKLE